MWFSLTHTYIVFFLFFFFTETLQKLFLTLLFFTPSTSLMLGWQKYCWFVAQTLNSTDGLDLFPSIRAKWLDGPGLSLKFGSHSHVADTKEDRRPVCGLTTASNWRKIQHQYCLFMERFVWKEFFFPMPLHFFVSGGRKQRSVSSRFCYGITGLRCAVRFFCFWSSPPSYLSAVTAEMLFKPLHQPK